MRRHDVVEPPAGDQAIESFVSPDDVHLDDRVDRDVRSKGVFSRNASVSA